jgi:hypothetical protein
MWPSEWSFLGVGEQSNQAKIEARHCNEHLSGMDTVSLTMLAQAFGRKGVTREGRRIPATIPPRKAPEEAR